MAEELKLHWRETVPVLGEVITEVAGNEIVVEGWAPGEPPATPPAAGTALWAGADGATAEVVWEYGTELVVTDLRYTAPAAPPASGRTEYKKGSTKVVVEWAFVEGELQIVDVDVILLDGVD